MKKVFSRILLLVMLLVCVVPVNQVSFDSTQTVEAASKISLSKKKATLIKGQSLQLKVKGTNKKVYWSSSKKKVASVSGKGKVTAKKTGTAVISAKVSGKKYKCTVKVESPKLNKTKASLIIGDSLSLKLKGNTQKVSWGSSDKSVATVSNGKVVAKSLGEANIVAKVGKKKYTCRVVVSLPKYIGGKYTELNGNKPLFTSSEKKKKSAFEKYSDLDNLGRCGVAFVNACREIMPTEERGAIGMVKPSGWHTVKYDIVDGKYLYNRCHLIGYQISAENANTKNLITGTRYLNVDGMLPFENMVAEYVKKTNNHVLYRVTPMFVGNNLVCHGVMMEAFSVEDKGKGICFNVFVHNVQPGVSIDYSDGTSSLDGSVVSVDKVEEHRGTYVINKNTRKFHHLSCSSVTAMKESNRSYSSKSREELINEGYSPCGNCNP